MDIIYSLPGCPGLHLRLAIARPRMYEHILYCHAINWATRFANLIDLATYCFERSNGNQRVRNKSQWYCISPCVCLNTHVKALFRPTDSSSMCVQDVTRGNTKRHGGRKVAGNRESTSRDNQTMKAMIRPHLPGVNVALSVLAPNMYTVPKIACGACITLRQDTSVLDGMSITQEERCVTHRAV